jgi:hypothetical protein
VVDGPAKDAMSARSLYVSTGLAWALTGTLFLIMTSGAPGAINGVVGVGIVAVGLTALCVVDFFVN